jgi:hypothetical protein
MIECDRIGILSSLSQKCSGKKKRTDNAMTRIKKTVYIQPPYDHDYYASYNAI